MMLRRSPLLSLLLSPNRHPSGRPSFVLVLRQTSLLCCVYPWLSPVYPFGSDDVAVAPHFPAAAKRRFLKGHKSTISLTELGKWRSVVVKSRRFFTPPPLHRRVRVHLRVAFMDSQQRIRCSDPLFGPIEREQLSNSRLT